MADKENISVAAAPPCSLISHIGKRESFLVGANNQLGPIQSCKGASSYNRFRSNRDINKIPRSQPFVPNKAQGLLSSRQMKALVARSNLGSRQRPDTMNQQTKGTNIGGYKDFVRKSYRTAANGFRQTNNVRQFKSLSNVESGKQEEAKSFSSSNDTAGSESVIKPMIGNRKFVGIRSSMCTKEIATSKDNSQAFKSFGVKDPVVNRDLCTKLNDIKFKNQRGKDTASSDILAVKKSFIHCKIPTCQNEDTTIQELPKIRSGSYNGVVTKKFVKEPKRKSSVGIQPRVEIKIIKQQKTDVKLPKIDDFRQNLKQAIDSGQHERLAINQMHASQLQKEVIDNVLRADTFAIKNCQPVPNPIEGHEVSKEYRTKMTDWMVEVCSSFKCSKRAYFLAVQIFDKYLTRIVKDQGKVLQNKDVHCIGVVSMFLGSKYEDVLPLSSKIVSEKIAHRAISAKEILQREAQFLNLFDFEIDFITHYDFFHTYKDKLQNKLKNETCPSKFEYCDLLCRQAMILIKMAIQNNDFTVNSPSVLVVAALYAATAFLKHSKAHNSKETSKFCTEARRALFEILEEDSQLANGFENDSHLRAQMERRLSIKKGCSSKHIIEAIISTYQKQFTKENVEKIAMKMVDFFKIFDDWHCGLNQLKKFNQVPIQ